MLVPWLNDHSLEFPPHDQATPEGILAAGGDLSPERLLYAYSRGIFPWYNDGEPILWWSPDPRLVLFPDGLTVAKSMRPYFNQQKFKVSFDRDFCSVIRGCQDRGGNGWEGTWINDGMLEAYTRLRHLGYAHSVEVWQADRLVGGLYGIALGKCFFGESMFTLEKNASKFGFISLVKKLCSLGFRLVDCQQETKHLVSLGARAISRADFLKILEENQSAETLVGDWGALLPG